MKQTVFIIKKELFPGSEAIADAFAAALQQTAQGICQNVEIFEEDQLQACLAAAAQDSILVLDVSMPLLTPIDIKHMFGAVQPGKPVLATEALPQGFHVENAMQASQALFSLRKQKNDALLASGVLLIDPLHTYIDPDVQVAPGVVIHPGCTLEKGAVIEAGCVLLPGCRIQASTVGEGCTVESSVLLSCTVGKKTTIGPFAYLRPGSCIGDHCRIGDFVEVKNSSIADGAKVSHLTYVGDSDVGKRVNIGCGVVFVNYDGKYKHRSKVADDAFIGCNTNLVSPIEVGEHAFVAAGTTLTANVPAGALALSRTPQVVKEGWVTKRKQKGKL